MTSRYRVNTSITSELPRFLFLVRTLKICSQQLPSFYAALSAVVTVLDTVSRSSITVQLALCTSDQQPPSPQALSLVTITLPSVSVSKTGFPDSEKARKGVCAASGICIRTAPHSFNPQPRGTDHLGQSIPGGAATLTP